MHKIELSEFPDFVAGVLEELIKEIATQSVWLIGSRANGCERSNSDWDFIVFVNDSICECSSRHGDVDVIRVDTNGQYLLEGQKINLCNSFEIWNWREIEPGRASYTVRKTPNVENGQAFNGEDVRYDNLKGIKVWQRNV